MPLNSFLQCDICVFRSLPSDFITPSFVLLNFDLCLTIQAGPYWVELMDSYGASFSLLIYGLCECIAISWFYGVKRFINDIRTMVGDSYVDFPSFFWWPLNWCAITPALLSVSFSLKKEEECFL